jgi:hypothetical protein
MEKVGHPFKAAEVNGWLLPDRGFHPAKTIELPWCAIMCLSGRYLHYFMIKAQAGKYCLPLRRRITFAPVGMPKDLAFGGLSVRTSSRCHFHLPITFLR